MLSVVTGPGTWPHQGPSRAAPSTRPEVEPPEVETSMHEVE